MGSASAAHPDVFWGSKCQFYCSGETLSACISTLKAMLQATSTAPQGFSVLTASTRIVHRCHSAGSLDSHYCASYHVTVGLCYACVCACVCVRVCVCMHVCIVCVCACVYSQLLYHLLIKSSKS